MSEVNYKICPICGGRMWQNTAGWTCGNCGAIETGDGVLYKNEAELSIAYEIARQTEAIEAVFWAKFRAEAAKDILCAIMHDVTDYDPSEVCREAIRLTDTLIKELNGK